MPHVVAPSTQPRGFMPVTGPGAVQGPTMGSVQPPSPQSTPVQPSVTAVAPPPTIQTADTSSVPGNCIYCIFS